VIRSFKGRTAERLRNREHVKALDRRVERVALRKLAILDAATTPDDLRSPPGNRLEALRGDRKGQDGIRIKDQWRI
jgi:proteic killer suppression protein